MDRRTYLGTVGIAGLTSVAGCLDGTIGGGETGNGSSGSGTPNTILEPPETDLSESSHPSYGDELPSLSLPDPLIDETISTDQFEDERAVLMTFIYTNCPDGMCPALTLRLRRTQEVAAENGFSDDVALLEMTFDPERDTESKLRTFADEQGVDAEADNWHFLRPETYDRAKTIMTEDIGLPLKKTDAPDYDHLEYMFPHYNLILLANKRGIVERAYPNGASIDPSKVVEDVETVVTE
ncbi:SCO family protein [Natrinema limicola]|uniref:Electron transport protein SCO1/SenC n=1 Tax=Natrinema limicola JCM 13563 TaxID=1230457 RepID=M0CD30_9EURY|nr:SCO family protein [Natrinema limicola]ELZ21186.1 electron transport protein SCO1/SenC [Natrinema limicola JCM 13563]